MRKQLTKQTPSLQSYYWPPVSPFSGYKSAFSTFLCWDIDAQKYFLNDLIRRDWRCSGEFLNHALSEVYAYIYGYRDSPCYLSSDPDLEIQIQRAKILIEEVYANHWLPIEISPYFDNVKAAYAYLEHYVETNIGVEHELFEYLRDNASQEAVKTFLRLEVCRNEVVDDEVCLLVCGLQGNLKRMTSANLWDECGNGDLMGFHTYWLRQILAHSADFDDLKTYRQKEKPWFSAITSNAFNSLLTRPGRKYRAYGCFTTTEAWVEPHFEKLLKGLERTGLSHPDINIYFVAHRKIDPFHTRELLDGILDQVPAITLPEIREIILGAHTAVAAGVSQYCLLLEYLRDIDVAKDIR